MQKNANRFIFITLNKTQIQMNQRHQIKRDTLNLIKEKLENNLEALAEETSF